MYNLFSFFLASFVLNLSDLVGILHLQHISMQTSHISSAQLPPVTSGKLLDGADLDVSIIVGNSVGWCCSAFFISI